MLENNKLKNTFHSEILWAYLDTKESKILLVRKNGLEVVWLADNPRQPFQKKGEQETVFSSQNSIKDARWFFGDNQHVVIQTDKNVLLISAKKGEDNPLVLIPKKVESINTLPDLPEKIFIKKEGINYKIEL